MRAWWNKRKGALVSHAVLLPLALVQLGLFGFQGLNGEWQIGKLFLRFVAQL